MILTDGDKPMRRFLLLVVVILLVSGCKSISRPPDPPKEAKPGFGSVAPSGEGSPFGP
jgi:hypothetical protein